MDGYHLTAASAAIDQGVDAGVTTDIDGQVRPMGLAPDLGADEFQPTTRYVATSGVDVGDCADSAVPCRTVQYTVDVASEGDTIKAATGIYTDVIARVGTTQVVYISKTVTIQGGYTTTNWITPYPITQPTTLDAQGQGRVLYITGNTSPTIEGLNITGGNGGGIYFYPNPGSAVTLISNTFTANTGTDGGGFTMPQYHYYSDTTATLIGNTFVSNTATGAGGGWWGEIGNITFVNNTFIANSSRYGGGGINFDLSKGSAITLISNTFTANTAGANGGGLGVERPVTTTSRTFPPR